MPPRGRKRKFAAIAGAAYQGFQRGRKLFRAIRTVRKIAVRKPKRRRLAVPGKEIFSRAKGTITKSRSGLFNKIPKGLKNPLKAKSKDLVKISSVNSQLCEFGLQDSLEHQSWGIGTDVKSVWTKAVDMNAGYKVDHAVAAGQYGKRLFLESNSVKTMYVNQGPSMIKCTFYDIISKNSAAGTPGNLWQNGMQDEGGLDNAQEVRSFVGSSPRDSSLFMKNYRIVKQTTVYMATGATHEHTFTHRMNKVINMPEMNDEGGSNVRGIWSATMVVIHGLPIDSVAGFTTSQAVSTDRAKLISITNRVIKSRILDAKGKHIDFNPNLGIITAAYNQNTDGTGVHNTYTGSVTTNGAGTAWA